MIFKPINDSPIKSSKEDLLNRRQFARNISRAIIEKDKQRHDCYAIGLYGKWGEGKTSLLNMIHADVSNAKSKALRVVYFNPWIFKDQESLLLSFFQTLQKEKIDEKFTESIKKYGPLVALGISRCLDFVSPGAGTITSELLLKAIDSFSSTKLDVFALKAKINKHLEESGTHLLIVIDDVDRLDKEEIHFLFKLIRQNADFVNTTYLIAMDVDMVAKSLAQRFENGDERSGRHFLEKIIQVPIYLPKIQQGHLYKLLSSYLFELFNAIWHERNEEDNRLIESAIKDCERYVFPLFTTVREIILYINSLSFVLPSIYKELNLSDLLLLEALKLFHNEAYQTIKDSKFLIVGGVFFTSFLNESEEEATERKKGFIKRLSQNASHSNIKYVEEIVDHLLYPFIHADNQTSLTLLGDKRLCTRAYFDKYFLYQTPDDLISDAQSETLLQNIIELSDEELLNQFETYYRQYDFGELKRVIYQILAKKYFYKISNEQIGKICLALSRLSVNRKRKHYVEDPTHVFMEFTIIDVLESYINTLDEAELTVTPDKEHALNIFEQIMQEKELNLFHLFLATHFCEKSSAYVYYREKTNRIIYQMLMRFANQHGYDAIFNLSQLPTLVLFRIWKDVDMEHYQGKIDEYLSRDDFDWILFVKKLIYNSDVRTYNQFCELFDEEKVYNRIKDIPSKGIPHYQDSIGYFIKIVRQHLKNQK